MNADMVSRSDGVFAKVLGPNLEMASLRIVLIPAAVSVIVGSLYWILHAVF